MPFTGLVAAEPLVRGWLDAQFPTARVVTELPANLADVVPAIQVTRFGGSDDFITLDAANIDIDTFAATRDASRSLSEQVRAALRLHLPGYAANGAAVQSVTTISAPRWVPYDNTSLRRFVASYRITIHSVPA
jgi:hypothetical protein